MTETLVGLTELDALLDKAGRLGFMVHRFRSDRYGPDVMAMVRQWKACADVFVLPDDRRSHAYRLPTEAGTDVLSPTHVCWWYAASPVWTLRALLTLPEPGQRDAPMTLVSVPTGAGIPGKRTPVRMRQR